LSPGYRQPRHWSDLCRGLPEHRVRAGRPHGCHEAEGCKAETWSVKVNWQTNFELKQLLDYQNYILLRVDWWSKF
jgi:hypothetical protein